jgi:adenylate cyclase
MSTSRTQHRRLAAILAADVVGYSRLMGQDEAGTLTALKALRTEVIDPKVAEHSGRVFKSTGDGCLAEFPSVVNAVACATDIQRDMAERNRDKSQNGVIQLRIGINLGDVIVEAGDVFGDGVNVAARIEGIAPPGGIAVTETVRDHLGSRLDIQFADLGEQRLKNIDRPIRAYKVQGVGDRGLPQSVAPQSRTEKPSIAVLPFTNTSGDPEQEYFADGVTEDLITELSRFRTLSVIARNSSFYYKGRSLKVQEVGRELGVNWVVEGSVRKSGNRVRVTAQLIDAANGEHVWAERYERTLEDIFLVQDAVVRAIASTVSDRVDAALRSRYLTLTADELKAYDLHLRAKSYYVQTDKPKLEQALAFSKKAIELNPTSAAINAYHGHYWFLYWAFLWAPDPNKARENAIRFSKRAIELDDADATARWVYGLLLLYMGNYADARSQFQRGLELNPNDNAVRCVYGYYLACLGEPEKALEQFAIAHQQNPFDPFSWLRGIAYFTAHQYEDAIDAHRQLSEPNQEVWLWMAASHTQLGQTIEAKVALERFLEMARRDLAHFPGTDVRGWENYLHHMMPYANPEDETHLREAVKKAGLPI